MKLKQFANDFVTALGVGLSWTLLLAISFLLEGFVLLCLWAWYLVPLGVPQINLFHAIGLAITVSLLTYHYYDFQKSEKAGIIQPINYLIVRPLVTLLIGWLLHFFV